LEIIEGLEPRLMLAGTPTYALTETFAATSLSASLVAGTTVHKTVTVDITNHGNTTLNAKCGTTVSFSLTSGTPGTIVFNLPEKLSIKPGHFQPITLPIAAIPDVTAGNYFLVVQITDPTGAISTVSSPSAGAIAAPTFGLSESLTSTTLPVSLVSGTALKANVKVKVTNGGNIPLTGKSTITLSASTTTGIPGTTIVSLPEKLSLGIGKSATVTLPITAIPALPDASYYLVVQVTDPHGVVTTTSTPGAGRIAAPFVDLTATFAPITQKALTSTVTITLTNTGNVADVTTLTEIFGFSTDAAGQVAAGSSSHVTTPKVTIPAGKSLTLRLTVWKQLAATSEAGTYYLTAKITDDSDITASAVSSTAVTKA
jgi:hypothetical protein